MSSWSKTKEAALVACGRHCCLCHKFCGTKIEVHHIQLKSEGGQDTFDNVIPLCLDCHADMTSYDANHPKGTKYSRSELIQHRDAWYQKAQNTLGLIANEQSIKIDKIVYEKLLTILPWNGSIGFLRRNNFAGFSFDGSNLHDLDHFTYESRNNPSFQFVDIDLEGLRTNLATSIDAFNAALSVNVFSASTPGWLSVPPDWEVTQPKRFREIVNAIHSASDLVCKSYDELIKVGTRKLGVLPDTSTP